MCTVNQILVDNTNMKFPEDFSRIRMIKVAKTSKHRKIQPDRQDGQPDSQTDRQSDSQTDRQPDRRA